MEAAFPLLVAAVTRDPLLVAGATRHLGRHFQQIDRDGQDRSTVRVIRGLTAVNDSRIFSLVRSIDRSKERQKTNVRKRHSNQDPRGGAP